MLETLKQDFIKFISSYKGVGLTEFLEFIINNYIENTSKSINRIS